MSDKKADSNVVKIVHWIVQIRGGLGALFLLLMVLAISGSQTILPDDSSNERSISDLLQTTPWPEADSLFRTNPRWLGADDAYSVDLGNNRVLWLFADTFVAISDQHTRRESVMIRNSIGIQSGYDPCTASIQFCWRVQEEKPRSFFPEENDIWFWPGHGIVVEDKLLIFLMAIRSSSGGLGFQSAGWRAVIVSNFEEIPSKWHLRWLDTPANIYGLVVSGSVIQMGEFIYAFCDEEPSHHTHLVRWPAAQIMKEDLSQPQWWTGEEGGWVMQQNLLQKPQPLFSEGQSEFSVHYEPSLNQFIEIQTVGFGKAELGFRLADHPTGRWSSIRNFYRPEEYEIADIMIYAAKAHPCLRGADMVLTYATNSFDFKKLIAHDYLYYPRFLRVNFKISTNKSAP
ncbi:DUF4185 domain-containing protein [bacterium]|nr:DUF4185 domain-containing protein [bacterium]